MLRNFLGAKLKEGDPCPHPECGHGYMEARSHRFSTERGPNLPDADWLQCDICDYATDPE